MTPFQAIHPDRSRIARKMKGRPRGDRVASMTVLAIAMIGINAAGADRAVSIAPDRAETRTPLVMFRAGMNGQVGPVVELGRPVGGRNKEDTLGTSQAILERELIRQAILIAARDELGLPTRDEILDDAPPDKGAGAGEPVQIAILFRPGECHALIRRGQGNQAAILQKHDLGTNPDGGNYTSTVTAKAEALSRIDFPALEAARGRRRAEQAPRRCSGAAGCRGASEDLEHGRDLRRRAAPLHAAIRADGESSARLSALARAYAQLGILTEFHWSPAHCAFKALRPALRRTTHREGRAIRIRPGPADSGIRPGAGRPPRPGAGGPRRGEQAG